MGFVSYLCGRIMQKQHGTSKAKGLKNKLQRSGVDPDEKVDVGVFI